MGVLKSLFFLALVVLLSSIAAAHHVAADKVIGDVRFEPDSLCAGESTTLFIEFFNDGNAAIRDSVVRISSSALGVHLEQQIDIPVSRSVTRAVQFSVPGDTSVNNYAVTVDLVGETVESNSAVLHVRSCVPVQLAGAAVGLPVMASAARSNYSAIAGVVIVELFIVLIVVAAVYFIRRKTPATHVVHVKKKN
ncbi:MAG TPA: hypothetical protein VJH88_03535 [Candidatus Nanoarchaeia archaeon]|nr:hypothetical protein [Candidatus Nanoarchaeia archaeon]